MTAPATIKNDALSLNDFLANPAERMEWIDGKLVEKNGMTLGHGEIQLRLGRYWEDYKRSSGIGGKVYTDAPLGQIARTQKVLKGLQVSVDELFA